MKRIPLTRGLFALVDDADYPWLSQWKWYAEKKKNKFYAARTEHGKKVCMHRLLCEGRLVDHVDGDSLNNQRGNLRAASSAQNAWNTPRERVPSKQARITYLGNTIYLGVFPTVEQAARAEEAARERLYGEYKWNG